MKYTFSIHGVPYGSQSWGDIRDSEYLKSFYNAASASNVPTQMIVDIRYSGNAICSYYHYLILSNVDDYESRPGSYFGMTICFEGVFCSDFVLLYRLFDTCFKKFALNSVLIKSGERYTYALADFDSANNIASLKRVDGGIRQNMHLFEHNLEAFPDNFTPQHRDDGWIEKWSIDDVGNKTFVNILLRDSMVSISPSYPISHKKVEILQGDNRAKENKIKTLESNNGNLQSENEKLRTKISDQGKDIEAKGATIMRQNVVITEHKETIATLESKKIKLENELKELKEELKQAQNNRDDETLQKCFTALKTIAEKRARTDQLINAINPRLEKAEENMAQINNQLNRKKSLRLTSAHFQLGAFVVVAIIAIAGIVLPTQKGGSYRTSDVQKMINESLKPINKTLDDIKKKVETTANNEGDGDQVKFIDIDGGGPTVKADTTYQLTAQMGKGQPLSKGGGTFVVIVKLTDDNEIKLELESKDGIRANLPVKKNWREFDLIYCYKNREVYRRESIPVIKK